MKNDDLHELWMRDLAGEPLSERERFALDEAIRTVPEMRDRWMKETWVDGALRMMGRSEKGGEAFASSTIDRWRCEQESAQFVDDTVTRARQRLIRPVGHAWQRWVIPLAAAASVAIVAGVWWFSQRQDGLGLRVAEVQGSGVRVQGSGGPGSGGLSPTPLRVGDILKPGDGIEVGADGYAKLAYPDRTQVELQRNTRMRVTLGAGREKTAKRLALDGGKLVCAAASQKRSFLLETPHAIAEVIGTRFRLAVAQAETALAVQEGKVALRQKDKSMEVKAGETAVADGAGLHNLLPEDSWIRELLARADAAPWDVPDLKDGWTHGAGAWLADWQGTPANWRVWQTDPQANGMLVFGDDGGLTRGVVVGRVMLLPDGDLPKEVAPPEEISRGHWEGNPEVPAMWKGFPDGVCTVLHWKRAEDGRAKAAMMETLMMPGEQRGIWYRFAVYFDTAVAPEKIAEVLTCAWPDGTEPPPVTRWLGPRREDFRTGTGMKAIFGLDCKSVRALWQGIKIVPLGPDMPLPPHPPERQR